MEINPHCSLSAWPLALAFGMPYRVIAERVHADEGDIQKYKRDRRGTPAAPNKRRQLRGYGGMGADGSAYSALLGLQRSRLTLTEGLKRLGSDEEGIGCAPVKLSTDRSMESQRNVRLLALSKRGNLFPSDAIGQAV
jgi:hypothetical protein